MIVEVSEAGTMDPKKVGALGTVIAGAAVFHGVTSKKWRTRGISDPRCVAARFSNRAGHDQSVKDRLTSVGRWLVAKPWPGLVMIVAGATFLALHLSPSTPPPGQTRHIPLWLWVLGFLAVLFVALGAVLLIFWNDRRNLLRNPDDRHRQIRDLTAALEKSMTAIDVIRGEVAAGERLLSSLEQRIHTQREISTLTTAEALAVQEALRSELRVEGRRSLWYSIVLGLVFFAVGTGVSQLLHR
jgi:hypothetical protein